jgi:hypothetical protein
MPVSVCTKEALSSISASCVIGGPNATTVVQVISLREGFKVIWKWKKSVVTGKHQIAS